MNTIASFSTINTGAILLLGYPGAGKTTLCTQLPAPWILHTDNNIQGPLRYLKSNPALSQTLKFDVIPKGTKRQDKYAIVSQLTIAACNDPTIHTLGFELTSLVDIMLDEVRRQQGRAFADGVKTFIDAPLQIQDWGAFAALLKNFVITVKSAGKIAVFNAHVETKEDVNDDSKSARLLKYISCPGQLRETLAGYFDEVWMIEMEEAARGTPATVQTVRYLRTAPSSSKDAALGLKTSTLGRRVELDFNKIRLALAQ